MDRRHALIAALSVAALGASGIAGCSRRAPAPADPPEPNRLYPWATADLFQPGKRHRVDTGDLAVAEVMPAGVLQLPTGRLVAADASWLPPLSGNHIGPYAVTVPPGRYPLTPALLHWKDLRVAAARPTIADQPVTSWELALRAGEDPGTLRPGEFFGVGVDAATIALFDAAALDAMGRLEQADSTTCDVWQADRPVERTDVAPGANAIAFKPDGAPAITRSGSAAPGTVRWAASWWTCLCSPCRRSRAPHPGCRPTTDAHR